ncbi:peptidase S8/S53 domain-containing protein [Lactarius quietus]|nr:peptidase S8/S53 domain-containing protein [Lactarius quietus]
MSPSTRTLDHIVHLTPPGTIHETAEQFRELGFNVISGGTHAGGLTANSLVIMPDGTYLELISFTHPESHYPPSSPSHDTRRNHPWANKANGWLAFAFLGSPHAAPPISTILNTRLQAAGSDTRYGPEVPGGRTRPDGVEIKWEVTTPTRWEEKKGASRLPFFCGDVTPRELRVPTRPESITEHPNTAQSIAHLRVLAPPRTFAAVSAELTAIVGEAPIEGPAGTHVWLLDLLPGGLTVALKDQKLHLRLLLCEPDVSNEAEVRFVESHGAGLYELGVRVEDGGKRGSSETPFGRIAWIPVPIDTLVPVWDVIHVKHTWNAIPDNWESLGCPPAGTTIDLYVALKPHYENALIRSLYEVSDPSHPKYGAHLSKEQVAELVAPHPETLELVYSWLEHHGVSSSSVSTTHGGNWLMLTGVPISQANELLGASYQLYRHTETNNTILRTVSYSLPTVLHAHVQTVAPTTYFASTRARWQTVTPPRRFDQPEFKEILPGILRWMYKASSYVPAATDRNVLAVVGYRNEYPSQDDLTTFMANFWRPAIDATFTVEKVNDGGYDEDDPGTEANIDVQYTAAITYPTPLVFYSVGGELKALPGTNKPARGDALLEWSKYVLDKTTVPQTITTSIGVAEADLPKEYAIAICHLFAQLGNRGASVIFASGDYGVGLGDCKSKDGSGTVKFAPLFPATCMCGTSSLLGSGKAVQAQITYHIVIGFKGPYVTAVGGTKQQETETEIAAELSGGGFSFYFPRPPYQDAAVPPYIKSIGDQYQDFYNPAGRGIPDISAQSHLYAMIENDKQFTVGGTSCAAPTVAGIFSLLNDYQLSRGRKPLGFLNPWLYGHGRAGLTDIKSGSNPGCGTPGFNAIPGWDPATGLGTPDFLILQYRLDHPAPPPATPTSTASVGT